MESITTRLEHDVSKDMPATMRNLIIDGAAGGET
jgi:hypothetical protein